MRKKIDAERPLQAQLACALNGLYTTSLVKWVPVDVVDTTQDRERRLSLKTPNKRLVAKHVARARLDERLKCHRKIEVKAGARQAFAAGKRPEFWNLLERPVGI
jgi:hypothetical protein